MGTLSGVNIANQLANPISELDFKVADKLQKVQRDIEYTFINGVYAKAEDDNTANKTRGLVTAVTSNVIAMGGKALGLRDVADLQKKVYEANAQIQGLVLWCDAVTLFQLNADAKNNGLTVIPAAREVNGIKLSSLLNPARRSLSLPGRVPACRYGPAAQPRRELGLFTSLFRKRATSSSKSWLRPARARSSSSSVRSDLTTGPSGTTASSPASPRRSLRRLPR